MKPTPKEIKAAKKSTSHEDLAEKTDRESQTILVAIEAVKDCQRPHGPPLLWLQSRFEHLSDDKDTVKEWIKGKNKRISARDLISDVDCVAGYESDFVIYLGSKDNVSAYMSRCRGQFVHIE